MNDDNDFLKSVHCGECGGVGYTWRHDPQSESEKEQCFECEELHRAEVRADRALDALKGYE